MENETSFKKHEINDQSIQIQKGVKLLSDRPCGVCSGKAEAVISFEPDDKAAFGAKPGEEIYIPICRGCLKNFDPVFMEAMLLHTGLKKELPSDEAA